MEEDGQLKEDILRLRQAMESNAKVGSSSQSQISDLDQFSLTASKDSDELSQGVDSSAGLPVVDTSLENCLFLNRMYQEFIQDAIKDFEQQLAINRELQNTLTNDIQKICQTKKIARTLDSFTVPFFKDTSGHVPPYNDDALRKIANNELDAGVRPPRPWSSEEKKMLIDAVASSSLEVSMRPIMSRKEDLCTELQDTELTEEQRFAKEREIKERDQQILDLTAADKLPTGRGDVKCDWLKISSQDFEGKRDAVECELFWRNYLCPQVTKSKWSVMEIQSLKNAVEEHGRNNWEKVAQILGTGRTALQCLEKYMTKCTSDAFGRKWSPEEDSKCIELIEKFRVGDFIPWHQVSYYMDGRTNLQIWNRWQKINPVRQRGKFSFQEDLLLTAAVLMLGPVNWWRIKEFVPGRTSSQCYDRWTNALDPKLSRKPFTPEEDNLILKMAGEIQDKRKWSIIKDKLKNRTDNMVYGRYLTLMGKKCKNKVNLVGDQPIKSTGRLSKVRYVKRLHQHLAGYVNSLRKKAPKDEINWCVTPTALLRHLVTETKYIGEMPARNKINPMALTTSTNQQLNELITKLQHRKSVKRMKRKNDFHNTVECELDDFFKGIFPRKRIGRPVSRAKLDVEGDDYKTVVSGFENVLRGHRDTGSDQPLPPPTMVGMAPLPPSWTSMDGFRRLLRVTSCLTSRPGVKQCMQMVRSFCPFDDQSGEASKDQMEARPSTSSAPDHDGSDSTDAQAYPMLFRRFVSIFFWPAVLSANSPKTEPSNVIVERKPEYKANLKSGRKRAHWRKRLARMTGSAKKEPAAPIPSTSAEPVETSVVDGEPAEKKRKRGRPMGPTPKKATEVVRRSSRRM